MTHAGFDRTFPRDGMTLGLLFPIESYSGLVPGMAGQVELASTAEDGGFAALWARDVPLLDPAFGDGGQLYDPWVWLTHIGAATRRIALGTASVVLPLRNPFDIAKAAASVDTLTGQRLVLGVATGDRPVEFPLFGVDYARRGEIFRSRVDALREIWSTHFPTLIDAAGGTTSSLDVLPKPSGGHIPLLVTGRSQQDLAWIARNADGWLSYPKPAVEQRQVVETWQKTLADNGLPNRPFAQSLYVDLDADPDAPPHAIHLGYRLGRNGLVAHLRELRGIGVSHVMLNLKYGHRPAADVLDELATHVVPEFGCGG
jgi:luciferase-type oxidoreductase